MAAWPARHAGDPAGEGSVELVGVAVDGKAVRGSRTGEKTAVHLLAPVPHEGQAVVSQRQTAARSDEIPAYAPLMEQLDLRGCVVTADATPTRTGHAEHVIARGGHDIPVVRGSPRKLRRQLRHPPWREVPPQHRAREQGHGRREIRRLEVCTARPGLLPHTVQAVEAKRRRTSRTTNKAAIKTIYAVTSLTPARRQPSATRHRPQPPGRPDEHRPDPSVFPVNGATPGGLRAFLAQVAFTWVCTQSVISRVGVPGVNTAATPRSSNSAMSRSGMMPPPNTGMSAASSSRSSCRTSSKSVI